MDNPSVLYRYDDVSYAAPLDESDMPSGPGRTDVLMSEFPVISSTPKGVWIDQYGKKRFINLSARRKFACITPEEALQSFLARKKRQIDILQAQLRRAKIAVALGEQIMSKVQNSLSQSN